MNCGKNIRGALSYNETKLNAGKATLLLASGFGCDVQELGFTQKLNRFLRNIEGASAARQTNTVHLSVNFAKEDKVSDAAMQLIAVDYMKQLGFGEQPFLVYRHHDAGHEHFHIVTTNIQEAGRPIEVHNLVQRKSEPARKEIELAYGLVPASSKKSQLQLPVAPADVKAAEYGQGDTKKEISNIVRAVLAKYKFTSIEELNAVLRQFNVVADTHAVRGKKPCTGIVYSVVDRSGYRVSKGISGSSIYGKPTYKELEKKFRMNQVRKEAAAEFLTNQVQRVLQASRTPVEFRNKLQNSRIGIAVHRDATGDVKEILFVSHASGTVYTTAELGLTPHGIMACFQEHIRSAAIQTPTAQQAVPVPRLGQAGPIWQQLMDNLLMPAQTSQGIDPAFRKKKRRKRKPSS